MPSIAAYAEPGALLTYLGPERAQQILAAGQASDPAALQAAATQALIRGAAELNETLARGGYAIPVNPAALTDETLQAQLSEELSYRNCVVAAAYSAGGVVDLPEGLKADIERTAGWLTGILNGTIDLLGIPRTSAEIMALVAGRVAFQPEPHRERNLDRRVFRAFSHQFGAGGGPFGVGREEFGG